MTVSDGITKTSLKKVNLANSSFYDLYVYLKLNSSVHSKRYLDNFGAKVTVSFRVTLNKTFAGADGS